MKGRVGRMVLNVVVVATVCGLSSACTETLNIRTDDPGAAIRVGGTDLGPVGKAGRKVKVSIAGGDVPYEVIPTEGEPYAGTIERTGVTWWIVIPALALPFCLAPGCGACAVVTVNPTSVYGLALGLLSGGAGSAVAALSLPTWWTIPCLAGSLCASGTPMNALFLAERTPDDVLITKEGARVVEPPKKKRKKGKKQRNDKKRKKRRKKRRPKTDVQADEAAYLPPTASSQAGVLY